MDLFSDNPNLRKRIYQVFLLIGLALGAIRVGYEAVDNSVPDLLRALLASYAFLGAGVGFLAQSHVNTNGNDFDLDDDLGPLPEDDSDIL